MILFIDLFNIGYGDFSFKILKSVSLENNRGKIIKFD
jgi:hypothetical protein